MEDTMDVDDDMRMEEDPAGGELPMSTDEDSNLLAGSPMTMKVVDDRMASDSPAHGPNIDNFGGARAEGDATTEMEADSANSNDVNNSLRDVNNSSRGEAEHSRQVISSTVDTDNASTEVDVSIVVKSETITAASSTIEPAVEEPNGVSEVCVATTWEPEHAGQVGNQSSDKDKAHKGDGNDKQVSCEQDPFLENNSESSKDTVNDNGDDDDPFGESAMEKQLHNDSQANQTVDSEKLTNIELLSQGQEDITSTKSTEEHKATEDTSEGQAVEGSVATQGNIDDTDTVLDHISVDDSSVSGAEPDHVSLDSDSDAEDSEKQKSSEPSSTTLVPKLNDTNSSKSPQLISLHSLPPEKVSDANDSMVKERSQSKSLLMMPVAKNGENASVELVDSDDEGAKIDKLLETSSKVGSVLGSLLKPLESETITRDTPKAAMPSPSAQTNVITLQSLLSADRSPVLDNVDPASLKYQYSVKPLSIPVFKNCLHCAQPNLRCSWMVSVAGRDYFICSEKCFKAHRVQRSQMLGTGGPNLSNTIQTSDTSTIIRKCSFCTMPISKNYPGSLTWEVMEFCNESCLSNYQATFTANCCNCKTAVASLSMGKYSVRFGHEVKQFCSPACLDTYKKGIKTCSFCQKNLQDSTEGFMASVGGKEQFRDFCSQECLEKYDCICNNSAASYSIENCVVCDNLKVVQYEVIFFDKVAKLCTDVCLAAYKFVNNIEVGICGMCNKYYDKNSVAECVTFDNDLPTTFCSKHCMNISVISKRKIVPCACCKAKKYNFDMIYTKGANNDEGLFVCSVNCLSMYSVSPHIVPTKSTCAHCKKVELSTFHITMSDATIRHFCCYECVVAFQKNFSTPLSQTSIPVPAGAPKRISRPVEDSSANITSATSSGLTIHSVSSLKTATPQTTVPVPPTNTNRIKHTTIKIPTSFSLKSFEMKNKWTQISVRSTDKSLSCHPKKQDKDTQYLNELTNGEEPPTADEGTECIEKSETTAQDISPSVRLIPIPVPIYIPYPAPMYTLPSPIPIPIPVPIVVPLLVPSNADAIKEIEARCNPLLISGKENVESEKAHGIEAEKTLPQDSSLNHEASRIEDVEHRKSGRKRDHEEENLEDSEPVKKARFDSTYVVQSDDPPAKKLKLKYMLGVNAWKNFVKSWNELADSEGSTEKPSLKPQLLSMRPCELNSSLSLFLRKSSRQNGEEYQPDLKFYLALGIQYYIFDNGQTDHIFGDIAFEEFTDALNEDAKKFLSGSDEALVSRVEEEHLWECMQLGANSPQVLIMTLMYYITLRCNLWTVDEHMRLTFDSFQKMIETNSKSSSDECEGDKTINITFNCSTNDESNVIERKLLENKVDRTRCPVRFYEFYITKCPEVALQRNASFYLMPESSCFPESPIWYKSSPLPVNVIEKMLNRVKMIKEICEARRSIQERTLSFD